MEQKERENLLTLDECERIMSENNGNLHIVSGSADYIQLPEGLTVKGSVKILTLCNTLVEFSRNTTVCGNIDISGYDHWLEVSFSEGLTVGGSINLRDCRQLCWLNFEKKTTVCGSIDCRGCLMLHDLTLPEMLTVGGSIIFSEYYIPMLKIPSSAWFGGGIEPKIRRGNLHENRYKSSRGVLFANGELTKVKEIRKLENYTVYYDALGENHAVTDSNGMKCVRGADVQKGIEEILSYVAQEKKKKEKGRGQTKKEESQKDEQALKGMPKTVHIVPCVVRKEKKSSVRALHEENALTARDIAARWQCSIDAVYDAYKSGELRGFEIGRLKRFCRSDVTEYERSHFNRPSCPANCANA